LPPELGLKTKKQTNQQPVIERLYHEADTRVAQRAKAKNELETEILKECSFKPAIIKPPVVSGGRRLSLDYRPIYQRVGEVQRQKRENLHKLQQAVEEEHKPTFAPLVNPNSRKLLEKKEDLEEEDKENRQTKENGTKRDDERNVSLMTRKEDRLEIKYKNQEKWQKELADRYTFAPQLNPNTEQILQQSEASGLDFLERLQIYNQKSKHWKQQDHDLEKYTFQPYINPSTKGMVEARQSRMGESELEKYERLSFHDKQKMDQEKQTIEERYYSQFSFKPNINKLSSSIAPSRSVIELYKDEKREIHQQVAKEAAEKAFQETYTFHPQLYKTQIGQIEPVSKLDIRNPENLIQRLKIKEQEKALKIEQEKREKQKKEIEGCTFTPWVNPDMPKQTEGPVVVRGLDRFLELKDLAKKLEDEKREREENAFKVKVPPHSGSTVNTSLPFTIPAPFHFHTRDRKVQQIKQQKIVKIEKEMRLKEDREMTFKPRTNAAQRARLIEKILNK